MARFNCVETGLVWGLVTTLAPRPRAPQQRNATRMRLGCLTSDARDAPEPGSAVRVVPSAQVMDHNNYADAACQEEISGDRSRSHDSFFSLLCAAHVSRRGLRLAVSPSEL